MLAYPRALALTRADSLLEAANRLASVTFLLLIIVLFFVRHTTVGARARVGGSAVAIMGTFGLWFVVAMPRIHDAPALLAASTAVIVVGLLWSIVRWRRWVVVTARSLRRAAS